MDQLLTAGEAAVLLGVSPATLYSYVSRGLLVSQQQPGPRIDQGGIRYRGRDAMALARRATLEQVALILWDGERQPFATLPPSFDTAQWQALRAPFATWQPLARAMALLAAAAPALSPSHPAVPQGTAERLAGAARLMRLLAAALLDCDAGTAPLHRLCADAWRLDDAGASLVRAALIDAALDAEEGDADALQAALARGLAQEGGKGFSGGLPGFGHPLYAGDGGDPRCRLLLALLEPLPPSSKLARIAAAGTALTGHAPNIDFALAAIVGHFGDIGDVGPAGGPAREL